MMHEKVLPLMRPIREMLLPSFGKVAVKEYKSAHAHDAVTELDIAVEEYVRTALRAIEPSIAFVGEETGGDRNVARFWLMDPIDGTGHFIRGLPFCTSQMALIEEGQVTFAVIYDFLNDVAYWAEKGQGAFANTNPIRVSNRPLAQSYCAYEMRHDVLEAEQKSVQLRERAILFKAICAGWEYAMIAAGKIEGRVNFHPYGKDYDFTPGALLVAEAGSVVANIGSRAYDYRDLNFIAANAEVYRALTEGDDALFPVSEQKIFL